MSNQWYQNLKARKVTKTNSHNVVLKENEKKKTLKLTWSALGNL